MASKFSSKSSLPITNKRTGNPESGVDGESGAEELPKFTNAQLNKLTKVYPSWLKDKSGPKQLPGIYQGVLGQVQLQPAINFDSILTNGQKLLLANKSQQQQQQLDYMNRFTDTERVHQLLSASQLSNETLATIWAHVNQTFPGKLTNREVCLALALIGIFQRLGEGEVAGEALKKDPFSLVKAEKKPPVPVLYPVHGSRQSPTKAPITSTISSSKSIPDKLSGSASSNALLVDFGTDIEDSTNFSTSQTSLGSQMLDFKSKVVDSSSCDQQRTTTNTRYVSQANSLSLIDMLDGDRFELEFFKLTQIWLKFLSSMRTIFKRSFDILNVENSRQSAIEALKSNHGKQFSKHLCLCYPIAHNIKFKIDQLCNIGAISANEQASGATTTTKKQLVNEQNNELFDKNYVSKIDDLMNSINEYWAVLINLFHESGQTKFIELIMDGLNYKRPTVASRTIGELADELNGSMRSSVCSICHTNFYLTSSNEENMNSEELELIGNKAELLSEDGEYYYHARCANFWLNHVDPSGLPNHRKAESNILSPASMNPF